jgi:hypothetical protein
MAKADRILAESPDALNFPGNPKLRDKAAARGGSETTNSAQFRELEEALRGREMISKDATLLQSVKRGNSETLLTPKQGKSAIKLALGGVAVAGTTVATAVMEPSAVSAVSSAYNALNGMLHSPMGAVLVVTVASLALLIYAAYHEIRSTLQKQDQPQKPN